MALDYQMAAINFGQGIDTKTDPKRVVQSKLLALQNGVFTQGGAVAKRNGYDAITANIIGGGTITSPLLVKSYVSRLICAAGGTLYDYSTTAAAWKNAGTYDSISVGETFISGANQNERSSTSVILSNYCVIAYDAWTNVNDIATVVGVNISAIDLTTNTFIASDVPLVSAGPKTDYSKMVLLAGTQPAVLYINNSGNLCIQTLTVSSSGLSAGGEISVATDVQGYVGGGAQVGLFPYDVVQTATGATVAYSSSAVGNPIKLINLNTSGSSTATGSVTAGAAMPISLVRDTTNSNIWIYWAQTSSLSTAPGTATSIQYAIVTSALASVLTKTQIDTGLSYVRQITALSTSTTTQTVYYSTTNSSLSFGGANIYSLALTTIMKSALQSNGTVGTPALFVHNHEIYGKPFTISSKNYMPCVNYSPVQNSGYLFDLSDGHIAGKFTRNTAESAYSVEFTNRVDVGGYWWRYPGHLAVAATYGSSQVVFSAGKILQNNLQATGYSQSYSSFLMGTVLVTFDWNNEDANQALESNGLLVLNGSVISAYDGSSTTELGFPVYPETDMQTSGAGGTLPNGSYTYQVVFQWYDAQGNLFQSGDSVALRTSTSGAGTSQVNLTIKNLSSSKKNSTQFKPQILIYRTANNGLIPYLLAQVTNDPTSVYQSYTDTGSVAVNQSQPIYTQGSAVVSNASVPSAMIMWLNNDRIWLIDSENPNTDAWYSKSFSSENGINFADELVLVSDPRLGAISAGIAMDEKTVLLKDLGLIYFIGDGANDAGQGTSFSQPQIIPSDVGCANSKGVILLPSGILFRANNNKGIYMLTRGIQVGYFGSDVESYNSQNITACQMLANRTQVRFLTSAGVSLVYDYFYNQWSTFTNHLGYSSTIWNGVYTYARTDGTIYTENSSTFLDSGAAYALSATTAWIKAALVQNLERIRMIEMLGNVTGISGHGIQILPSYDFVSSNQQTTSPFSFVTSGAPFQFRAFLPQQKADAIQFVINEITTGVSGEFVQFTDLGIEIGLKRGFNKLPAAATVG